jgi:hypothetical protein
VRLFRRLYRFHSSLVDFSAANWPQVDMVFHVLASLNIRNLPNFRPAREQSALATRDWNKDFPGQPTGEEHMKSLKREIQRAGKL